MTVKFAAELFLSYNVRMDRENKNNMRRRSARAAVANKSRKSNAAANAAARAATKKASARRATAAEREQIERMTARFSNIADVGRRDETNGLSSMLSGMAVKARRSTPKTKQSAKSSKSRTASKKKNKTTSPILKNPTFVYPPVERSPILKKPTFVYP
jgi:hypothetical protein